MSDKVTFIDGELEEYYPAFSIGRSCRLNVVTMKIVGLRELNCTVHYDGGPEKVNFCWKSANGNYHEHELEMHSDGSWRIVNAFTWIDGEPKWLTSVNPDETKNPL